MKTLRKYFMLFIPVLTIGWHTPAKSQCASNFTFTSGPNGQINFISTSSGTTAITSYTWNFGAPYLSPVQGIGTVATQAIVTYTSNGTYIVSLSISCGSTFTMAVPVSNILTPTCSINFSTAAAASSIICSGSATASAVGLCGTITYTWLPTNANGATQFSLCPTNYTILASGSINTLNCCPTTSAVVTIPQFSCTLNASFVQTVSPFSGAVSFSSNSTGTTSSSSYNWNYGDGSATGIGLTSNHSYSASGTYSVKLTVNNNSFPNCIDTIVQPLSVNVVTCNLLANFVYSVAASSFMYFRSTSSNTISTTSFSWNFGDGTLAVGPVLTHSYSVPGTYTVTLTASNSSTPFCTSTKTLNVLVPSVNCTITPAYTHTVGSSGVVTFSSNYSGTAAKHFWNFGDGFSAIVSVPTHTYTNAGTHYVKLVISDSAYYFCRDSVIQSINITGVSCIANSGFTLVPTGTPKFWNAIPNYPYNVSGAVWNWGDGSSSNGLYSSHVYSVAGTYTICLSTTVSCGSSSSYCFPYAIAKPAGGGSGSDVYSINVVPPALSVDIEQLAKEVEEFNIFPNPNGGKFTVKLSGNQESSYLVTIYDLCGRREYQAVISGEGEHVLELIDLENGLHFVQMSGENLFLTKKLIINK